MGSIRGIWHPDQFELDYEIRINCRDNPDLLGYKAVYDLTGLIGRGIL